MTAHIAPPDRILTGTMLLLITFGVIMIGSASLSVAEVRYGDPLRIITHWLLYIPVGLFLTWAVSYIHPEMLKAMALPLLGFGLLVLLLVLLFGSNINGATRWFSVLGMTLQPVELVKPLVIIYMAYYISAFPERLRNFSTGIAPMLVIAATAATLLLLQPDFGNAVLLSAACIGIWFVGGVPLRHIIGLVAAALPIGVIAIVAESYRLKRLLSFTDPWADPLGSGYQLVQSMIAFGVGHISGSGLGQGVQKLFYLPEAFTDFIAAVIAEELGIGGTLALILLFVVLVARGLKFALDAEGTFERLLALGCTLLIAFSCIINFGAVMGILPTKGMPMPFISYGGSALFGNCILIGLLLSVQRHNPLAQKSGNRRLSEVQA